MAFPISKYAEGVQIWFPIPRENTDSPENILIVNQGASAVLISHEPNTVNTGQPLLAGDNVVVDAKLPWYAGLYTNGLPPTSLTVQPYANAFVSPVTIAQQAATAAFNTGARVIDNPATTNFTLIKNAEKTIDISQSMSIALTWTWKIGATAKGSASQFKYFARLTLQWEDSAGNILSAEKLELLHEGSGTPGAISRTGQFTSPAMGSICRIRFEEAGNGFTLNTDDSASVLFSTSLRTVDKQKYTGYKSYVAGQVGDDAILGTFNTTGIAASAVSGTQWFDCFDGLIELTGWCSNPGNFAIYIGSWSLSNLVSPGTAHVYTIVMSASGHLKQTFQCPRSNIGFAFSNGATGPTTVQMRAVRAT
jgi:hypothetical protein